VCVCVCVCVCVQLKLLAYHKKFDSTSKMIGNLSSEMFEFSFIFIPLM